MAEWNYGANDGVLLRAHELTDDFEVHQWNPEAGQWELADNGLQSWVEGRPLTTEEAQGMCSGELGADVVVGGDEA